MQPEVWTHSKIPVKRGMRVRNSEIRALRGTVVHRVDSEGWGILWDDSTISLAPSDSEWWGQFEVIDDE